MNTFKQSRDYVEVGHSRHSGSAFKMALEYHQEVFERAQEKATDVRQREHLKCVRRVFQPEDVNFLLDCTEPCGGQLVSCRSTGHWE